MAIIICSSRTYIYIYIYIYKYSCTDPPKIKKKKKGAKSSNKKNNDNDNEEKGGEEDRNGKKNEGIMSVSQKIMRMFTVVLKDMNFDFEMPMVELNIKGDIVEPYPYLLSSFAYSSLSCPYLLLSYSLILYS